MTQIVRMNRVRPMDIVNEFERLFERPFDFPMQRTWNVAVDVAENEDGYVVKASLPGINIDDLDITFEDNVLTLRGELKLDENINEEDYVIQERRYGQFVRSIRFPTAVDSNKIEATYENGILTLNVPKMEEVKPKHIKVKVS
ncbi:MAG TPA: Hsp20/alpha crystallin family protein [Anaerolineae bacterium]|nr:Hsp20/alpha crystallin family protein [Anaerolineae bacterium]